MNQQEIACWISAVLYAGKQIGPKCRCSKHQGLEWTKAQGETNGFIMDWYWSLMDHYDGVTLDSGAQRKENA